MNGSFLSAIKVQAFLFCMMFFSYYINSPSPLRQFAVILLVFLALLFATENDLVDKILGKNKSARSFFTWTILASAASFCLAAYSRIDASLSALPRTLFPFTITAMCIGALEELLFRGWLYSQVAKWAAWVAIVLSSAAHALYKSVLFLSPDLLYQVDSANLFAITFFSGLFLGLTRTMSGSIWPALIAHVLFDLLIYGDQPIPWWVF